MKYQILLAHVPQEYDQKRTEAATQLSSNSVLSLAKHFIGDSGGDDQWQKPKQVGNEKAAPCFCGVELLVG
jgi:hypothetical protein